MLDSRRARLANLSRSSIITAGLAFATACGGAAAPAGSAQMVVRSRMAMSSELRVSAWTSDSRTAGLAFDEVFAEFDRLDAMMSVWKDHSDVQRLNDAAGDHPVRVSPEVIEVLSIGREVSEWTRGKFDVTFGALSGIWKFDHDQDNRVPDADAIRRQVPFVDYRELSIDQRAGTAMLQRRGMRVHLGGIGKGYAVDRAAAILRGHGLTNFMIQAGGDLYVAGLHDGQPWRLGIRDPRGPAEDTFGTLDLTDGTFSTSGDYERFFFANGHRYHHILDPDTGSPATACRSVTIVSDRAVLADAVAKGVFILGPQDGMALVERLPQIEVVIVSNHNEVLVSSGLRGRFVERHPPTDAP